MKRSFKVAVLFLVLSSIWISPGKTGLAQEVSGNNTYFFPLAYTPPDVKWIGPDGGSVVCLSASTTNTNVVFAGTLHAGVFKSTDRGKTWAQKNNGLGNFFIDSIAVDPTDGNIVYAGTHGAGVYKSDNGGEAWYPVNSGIADQTIVYSIAVNPGNNNLVYAGTRIEGTEYHGILYKSDNGGASWKNVMDFSDDWIYSVAVNPSFPNIVLAAIHTRGPVVSYDYGNRNTWNDANPPSFENDYLVGRWQKGRAVAFDPRGWTEKAFYTAWHGGFVSYSTDNGASWQMSSGDLGAAQIYPNGISIKPGDPNMVYLADHDQNNQIGSILRSSDSGESYGPTGLNGYFYSVAALPGSGETVLAGTYSDGLYRSEDGGDSWVSSMAGIVNSQVTGMAFPNRTDMYASTHSGGGVLKSSDGGASWQIFNNGLGNNTVNGLVSHPTSPNILFALTSSAGLRRIDLSSSNTWQSSAAFPSSEALQTTDLSDRLGSSMASDDDVFDAGDEALYPSSALMTSSASASALSLNFAPSAPNIGYLGTGGAGVYKSNNNGSSWSYVGLSGETINDLAVSISSADVLYAATNENGAIKKSTNGGSNWATIALPADFRNLSIYAVAIVPSDPTAVYVGTSSGVFRYAGTAWMQTGLSDRQVIVLAQTDSSPSLLFAGTNAGAYQASVDSMEWGPINNILNSHKIPSISFNSFAPDRIYVGTETLGTLRIQYRPR